jgi:hypothetical protein
MASQMTVVAVRQTGHILGAITSVAPAGKATVADVAGDAVPFRVGTGPLAIPATELAVAELGFDARVFADPHDARVVFASPPDQDASLAFLNLAVLGVAQVPSPGDTLTVTTSPLTAVTADTPFWILFQDTAGGPPVVVVGKIPDTESVSEDVAHGLAEGTTYRALVLLAGFGLSSQTITR